MNFKLRKGTIGIITAIILVALVLSIIPMSFIFIGNQVGIFLLVFYYMINIIFLSDIWFKKRTNIRAQISWTTLLVILPGAGALIYYWGGFVPFKKRTQLRNLFLIKNETKKELSVNPEQINKLFNINFENQNRNVLLNSEIDFLDNGLNKFPKLINDLENANTFINIQYFIINDGIIWKKIESILIKKLSEGIKVSIFIDYLGSIQTSDNVYKKIIQAGANFYQFNKSSFLIKNGFSNFRAHNKFVIIDNEIAYFGGMNIGDDYANLYGKYGTWFDLQLRAKGELVHEFNKHFVIQWNLFNNKNKIDFKYDYKTINYHEKINVQFFTDGPEFEEPQFILNFINLINQTNKTIKIVTPYIVLPKKIILELEKAVRRGIVVEIITSGRADKKSAYKIGEYFVSELIFKGIKIYRTNNIFIHSKFFLFDDEISIFGTTNLDFRALYIHFESNILIQSVEKNSQLDEIFNNYKKNSYLENSKHNIKNPITKFKYLIIKLFSPMF